jgi:hypothetical protein
LKHSGDFKTPQVDERTDTLSTLLDMRQRLISHSIVSVEVGELVAADSPRLAGENLEHSRALAESEVALPPIIVHRPTMRVIDGTHRLRAAVLRGAADIEVQFFDGDDEDAFVLAVQQNIAHGLPLSIADRKAAAERIISSHPQWSNRVIATATGLAANTVRAIRNRLTDQIAQSDTRIGRDGRTRPLTTEEGRTRAGALMTADPTMSLRAIAKAAGIAPETVRDVRERLHRGEQPIPTQQRRIHNGNDRPRGESALNYATTPKSPILIVTDLNTSLGELRKDPSIRLTESGRTLLRLLAAHQVDWSKLIDEIPTHCASRVAGLARRCAEAWRDVAEQVETRASLDT